MSNRECLPRLTAIGISYSDAESLRRIAMTLHHWHELECGDGNDYASWAVVRGRKANSSFEYDDAGTPFIEKNLHTENKARYYPIPDRERGALKRLVAIMARYPSLSAYVQGDPRGASLYILRPGDVPAGANSESYYSRGVAVYK
jgi:hypothetical protein